MTNNIGKLIVYKEDDSKKEKYIDNINIGDLIFFHEQSLNDTAPLPTNHYPGHVGIYIGDKQFIHASNKLNKIEIESLNDYWIKKLVATKDILTDIIKL